jgi:hypothetical protein
MLTTAFKASAIALTGVIALAQSVNAADLRRVRPANYQRVYHYRDDCGCFHWTYVRHRELRYTYGWNVDPRSFDMTEPYFYRGPMRTYVRYW